MNELLDRMMEAHRFWTMVKGGRIVSAQRDFPNCRARYTKCCYDDREFWDGLQKKYEQDKSENGQLKTDIEVITQTFIGSPSKIILGDIFKVGEKTPKDFEGADMPKVRV